MESLPNYYYTSSDTFKIEKENLFRARWIFACMEDEVAEHNDYYEFTFTGIPIVIQNIKGIQAAFINVCPHRFNKIQENTRGNRPFFCAYHAWGFDSDGKCKIPNADKYEEGVLERRLTKLPLERCGKFFFISLDPGISMSLQEFLGDVFFDLLNISELIERQINFSDIPHSCNWKLIIENALECLHCKFIHAESFFTLGFGGIPAVNTLTVNGNSRAEYPRSEKGKALLESNKFVKTLLEARVKKSDDYHHLFIFPNLLIGSVSFMNVYIGNVLPITESSSALRVRNYDVHLSSYNKEKSIYNYMMEEAVTSNYTILKEDKAVIENIQVGLSAYNFNAILSHDEFRIKEFQNEYSKLVNKH